MITYNFSEKSFPGQSCNYHHKLLANFRHVYNYIRQFSYLINGTCLQSHIHNNNTAGTELRR